MDKHCTIDIKTNCPFCVEARDELLPQGVSPTVHIMDDTPEGLQKMKELDKPFILILPTLCIQTKYMKQIFNDDLQVIMTTKKMFFYKFNEDGSKHKIDKLSYYCCYVCYKMNLPKDFILI